MAADLECASSGNGCSTVRHHAKRTLQETNEKGQLELVKDIPTFYEKKLDWIPFIEDPGRRSYSYFLPAEKNTETFPDVVLNKWFQDLHPHGELSRCHNDGGWTDAFHQGELLLRKTAWCPFEPDCSCDYGYADTWQVPVTDNSMKGTIAEITEAVQRCCGVSFNSVNLNYYPEGGGVGFHADDEFLFDGLKRDTLIVSLSLCNKKDDGIRKFQVNLKRNFQNKDRKVHDILLGHGDLLTMEGLFQRFYLHSVWPGDDKRHANHELCQGERINLTWRTIVQHLDGTEQCRFKKCKLTDAKPS